MYFHKSTNKAFKLNTTLQNILHKEVTDHIYLITKCLVL